MLLFFSATAKGSASLELEAIQERYMQCLQSYVEHHYPQSPGRFSDLLTRLPEVSAFLGIFISLPVASFPFLQSLNATP